MNDVQQGAEPSTAQPQAHIPTDSAGYANWRLTGKTPAPEAAAPSKEAKEDSGAGNKPAEKTASEAAKEAAKEQKPRRSTAETRLEELLGDLKRAGLSPAELKTFKREAQTAEAQPKPEHTEKPAELKKPDKPDQSKFDSWDEYQTALDTYRDELVRYETQKALAEYQASENQKTQQRETRRKLDEAKARYGDAAESTITDSAKALWNDAQIPDVLKGVIGESEVLGDVLYTLGSNAEEFAEFQELARTNPAKALRKFALVEHFVAEELAKGGSKPATEKKAAAEEKPEATGRDESGKFAKKVTEAPPPPREASGHASPPADEVDTAAKANDFTRFRNAANRRDLARRRGI